MTSQGRTVNSTNERWQWRRPTRKGSPRPTHKKAPRECWARLRGSQAVPVTFLLAAAFEREFPINAGDLQS
jgi:hypothetical protein